MADLLVQLFVAGYMLGPLLWGPLSEIVGRRPVFIVTFIAYEHIRVGCGAETVQSGAIIADIWEGDHRGQAMSLFALAPFAGPAFGPIVAGYISVSGTVGPHLPVPRLVKRGCKADTAVTRAGDGFSG